MVIPAETGNGNWGGWIPVMAITVLVCLATWNGRLSRAGTPQPDFETLGRVDQLQRSVSVLHVKALGLQIAGGSFGFLLCLLQQVPSVFRVMVCKPVFAPP